MSAYLIQLTIKDGASGQSGQLSFTGYLSGDVYYTTQLTNSFTGPTSQSLSLGGHTYTVTLGDFVEPGNPTLWADNSVVQAGGPPGEIDAFVKVSGTPEPASLALLGCAAIAGFIARRRRTAAPAA